MSGRWCCWSVDVCFDTCCQSGTGPLRLQTPKLAKTWKSYKKLQFWLRGGKSSQAWKNNRIPDKLLTVIRMIKRKIFDWLYNRYDFCLANSLQITSIKISWQKKLQSGAQNIWIRQLSQYFAKSHFVFQSKFFLKATELALGLWLMAFCRTKIATRKTYTTSKLWI